MVIPEPRFACQYVATHPDWYNWTHSPCHRLGRSNIVQALCPTTCANTPLPAAPTPPPTPLEDDPQGASYDGLPQGGKGARQLYTTSFAGKTHTTLVINVLHGNEPDAKW